MRCRKCKTEIPDESKFCLKCGAKQSLHRNAKSRGNGQGSAYKRGNTWTAIWTERIYLDENDRLHQIQRTKGGFKSKTAALQYAANPPQAQQSVAPTVRFYWNSWSKSAMLDLSPSKQTAYRIAWKKMASIADRRMDELSIADLQACVDDNAQTFYPARDMRVLLSHFYRRAIAEGVARTNLSEFIRLPQNDEKEMQPFTEIELHKLWGAYGAGNSFYGYILLMIYTGMMPGELMSLKADMIDFDTHEIIGCGLKTKKRKETPIVFPDLIVPVLVDLIERSDSRIGKVLCMNKDAFYDRYHHALTEAGVRDLPPYSCRHTTATALALGNIAPSVIQEVMRHTKFTTTQRYIHPDSTAALGAVNSMGKGASK